MPLTDTSCRNAKKQPKLQKLSDGGGLHLLVTPEGGKYWRLNYRFGGKQRTLALGVYPTVTLLDARAARDVAKRELTTGADPSAAKKARKRAARVSAGTTFESVARDWFAVWKTGRTANYAEQVMRRLEADVFPQFGSRPIAEIDAPEVLDALRKVEARGTLETARRLRQVIGGVFRFAIVERRAKHDPAADLKGALKVPAPPTHHKAMSRRELPAFLRAVEKYDGEPRTRLGLRLVVLTFVRTKELRAAQWPEFENLDGTEPIWRVPRERMKKRREHLVPLPPQAVAALRELRALPGSDATPFLFPSPGKEGCMSNNTLLFALYRMGYHGRATVHGFRGLASTVLNEAGFNADHIEMQLAHVERNKVRGAYNAAQWLPDRRKMLAWWADFLDSERT